MMRCLILAFALALACAGGARAEPAYDPKLGEQIRAYLIDHPEVVIDAIQAHREQGRARAIKAAESDDAPRIGPAQPRVTLVVFFDYNCGYCRKITPDLFALSEQEKDVAIVFREWPILGTPSAEVAKVALALRVVAPDKYGLFHRQIMGQSGRIDAARALAVAESLGVDRASVEITMSAPAIAEHLRRNADIAHDMGFRGTPSLLLGGEVDTESGDLESMKKAVAAARARMSGGIAK